uniref:SOSEKI DIX-like domain-containing protein n=1 Tax=Cucumis melo TaxID=3656 RepID=A0A1S3CEM9_CUCME
MEANNNNRGGEIRKVHIIYFLSRMGHVEQPHLIRVHHLAGASGGVYLRDVKRWLGELRGKEMPEAFSWSYKRKYKTGYVWQDLVDDDLITPISDNEYVLQGSQIIFPSTLFDTKKSLFREELELSEDFSSKLQQRNAEQSPPYDSERSTVTDDGDSVKVEEETTKNLERNPKQGVVEEEEVDEIEGFKTQYSSSSLYAKLANNKKEKDKDKDLMGKEGGTTATSTVSSSSQPAFTKSKSYSSGASHVFRQLITCGTGAVDTNDTVLVKNRSPKDPPLEKPKNDAVVCRDEVLGGSARVIGSSWDFGNLEIRRQTSRTSVDDLRKKRPKENGNGKVTAATTYKPMAGPNCSLCGKTFRPEKMHSHMKSCRGIKSLTKNNPATSDKTTLSKSTTTTTSDKDLVSTYMLTN